MIKRVTTLYCDGCPTTLDCSKHDYQPFIWATAKRGWRIKVRKVRGSWREFHYCPKCKKQKGTP